MLEHQGHRVVVVSHGGEALAALDAGRFDVVLMDLQMPEMDGFEALRAIREREAVTGMHMSVVALTAHVMQGDRERCLGAGFDGYLAKPIRQADLQQALAALVPDESPGSRLADRSLIEGLTEICDGVEDFAHELALSFLESAPDCLAAIDLAVQSGDSTALAAQAHALKGISRTIGAEKMALASGMLEELSSRGDLDGAARAAVHLASAWDTVRTTLEDYLFVEIKQ